MTTPLVFITGASSGIGQALALRFHQAGYRLALAARRTEEVKTWATAQGISADSYEIYSADVAVTDSIVAAGQACLVRQGVPDVVIANAGISVGMDTADFADLEVMRATFETNNLGMAATFQPFVAAMCQRGSGKLVGIASVAGIRGLPGHGTPRPARTAPFSWHETGMRCAGGPSPRPTPLTPTLAIHHALPFFLLFALFNVIAPESRVLASYPVRYCCLIRASLST